MIFDIFDLSGTNLISDQELSQMLLTMPEQAIITTILDNQTRKQTTTLGQEPRLSDVSSMSLSMKRRQSCLDARQEYYRV